MKNATTIVTGGAGFIGSHLCKALLDKGNRVICIDNLITGTKRNIDTLMQSEKFTFIEYDVSLNSGFSAFNFQNINQIYHLASPASPIKYQKYPLETMHVNSIGTENMLSLAKEQGAKFLYTSTSEVYGDPLEHPQRETYWGNVNSYGARSCYDEAKRFGEALIYTYLHEYAVDARIVRTFNTYGPNMNQNDGRVVSNIIGQAIRNEPVTIYGDGNQTRSFCYVSDMVTGIIGAMESEETKDEVINLGNPDERKIDDIASIILKLSESSSEKIYKDRPEDDPVRRKPDISKAQKLLGWGPAILLEEGLHKTIEYFRTIQ